MKYLMMLSLLLASTAQAGPQSFAYEGRLLDPSGNPVVSASVSFTVQVRSPNAADCRLYEENHTKDLSATNGYFSLDVGGGTSFFGSIAQAFTASGTISGLTCTLGGTTYTPAIVDGRKLRISFNDGGGWQTMTTDLAINSAPFAMVADTLQGKSAGDFLQPSGDLTQANLLSVFASPGYVAEMVALAQGNSSVYAKASNGVFSGSIRVSAGALPGSPAAGTIAVDSGAGNALKWYDGAAWQTVGTGGGSVTSVTAGTGISASGTASAPVIGLANTAVAAGSYGSASQIPTFSVDAQGRLIAASSVALSDASKLPLAGGAMTGVLSMGNNSISNIGHVIMSAQGTIYLGKFDSTQEGILAGGLNGTTDRGRTWYNTTINKMRYWDGSAAQSVGSVTGGDITTGLGYTPVNKAGDTMTGLLVLSGDPSNTIGAATKQYVDAVSSAAAGAYVRIDGTTALTADWDANGATAGGTRKILGLAAPTVADGAATKAYVDSLIGSAGTVNNVSSANSDVAVATSTTTPVLTLNSGTGPNQIVKLNGSAELPAVSGINLTALSASNITAGTLNNSRLAPNVVVAPSAPGAGELTKSIRWNAAGTAWEYFTPVSLPGGTNGQILQHNGAVWSAANLDSVSLIGGSAAAPSLKFLSDSDTGIFQQSADNIQFSTGGVLRGFFSNTLNQFNGTTEITNSLGTSYSSGGSPQLPSLAKATISNSAALNNSGVQLALRVRNSSTTDQHAYIGAVSSVTGDTPSIVIGQQTGPSAYQEKIRIDPSGSMGIGTTSPMGQLEVVTSSMSKSPLVLRGVSSQTANLIEVRDSVNTVVASIGPNGELRGEGLQVGGAGPLIKQIHAFTMTGCPTAPVTVSTGFSCSTAAYAANFPNNGTKYSVNCSPSVNPGAVLTSSVDNAGNVYINGFAFNAVGPSALGNVNCVVHAW